MGRKRERVNSYGPDGCFSRTFDDIYQAAEHYGISDRTIRRLINSGKAHPCMGIAFDFKFEVWDV